MAMDFEKELQRQLPEKKEKTAQLKQVALKGLVGFISMMMVLTVLSKISDAIVIPKVQVDRPKSGRIEQKIKASGILVPNENVDLEVASGLLVKEIFVEEGDCVVEGQEIMLLDAGDIEDGLGVAKNELKKLELRLQKFDLAGDIPRLDTPIEMANEMIVRLEEDKLIQLENENLAISRQQLKVEDAKGEVEKAEVALEAYKVKCLQDQITDAQNAVKVAKAHLETQKYERDKYMKRAEKSVEEARAQLWITQGDATMAIQNYERVQMEYEFTKSDWNRTISEAKVQVEEAETKLEALQDGQLEQEVLEVAQQKVENAKMYFDTQENLLADAIAQKEDVIRVWDRQLQDANKQLEKAVQEEANNKIEEVNTQQQKLIDREIMVLDMEQKQKEVQVKEAMIAQGGILVAPCDGIVTEIKIEKGDKTGEGSFLGFVSNESSYALEVTISGEESKYLEVGDEVEVRLEDENNLLGDAVIEKISHIPGSDDEKEIRIMLPKGKPGMSATMYVTKSSDKYNHVVPIAAIRGQKGEYYVFVARKRVTTLGEQWIAEPVNVTIADKNLDKVAIEASLEKNDEVIIKSNKPIAAGDRVRLIER